MVTMIQTPIHLDPMCLSARRGRTRSVFSLVGLLALILAVSGVHASAQVVLSNAGPLTLKSGTYGSVNVTVTPPTAFTGTIFITCNTTSIPYAYCIFPNLSNAVAVGGSPVTFSLTVNTSQVNQYQAKNAVKRSAPAVALCMLLPAGFALFLARKRRIRGLAALQMMAGLVVLGAIAGLSGCASTKPNNTPTGTYTLPITGSYNNGTGIVTPTTLSLIVN
jgi:hypothetical protein